MKSSLIAFSLTVLIISCTPKKNEYRSIEMMAYNWSGYNDTTGEIVPAVFKCRIYINIDKSGKADVYAYSGYPRPNTTLCSIELSKNLIDSVLYYADILDTNKLNIKLKKPRIYDGPIIKLRINYLKQESKFFDFSYDEYNDEIQGFLRVYDYTKSVLISNKYNPLSNPVDFEKSRLEFVEFVTNYDAITYPSATPPSPVDSIKDMD